jgi:hypothetical protein
MSPRMWQLQPMALQETSLVSAASGGALAAPHSSALRNQSSHGKVTGWRVSTNTQYNIQRPCVPAHQAAVYDAEAAAITVHDVPSCAAAVLCCAVLCRALLVICRRVSWVMETCCSATHPQQYQG